MEGENVHVPELGTLDPVDPYAIWKHEAHDFTPWLMENSKALGEALGMDLELHESEHPVGSFRLDLHGTADGAVVIVENQLTTTDHSHLGQLLTYAGGTEPRTIVWIATSFREEHRAALDWLNRSSIEDVRFFGVEVGVVRIGDSLPAPVFTVVAKPNDWGKAVKTATTTDGVGLLYADFWSAWLELVHRERPAWTSSRTAPKQSWMTLPIGTSEIWYGVGFTMSGLQSEIYFGSSDPGTNLARFKRAEELRAVLETGYGGPLDFQQLEGRTACRICDLSEGTIQQEGSWPDYLAWFLDSQTRLRQAVAGAGGVQAFLG